MTAPGPTAPPVVHLAPTGRLRAVVNLGNPVLAQGTADEPAGVTVDLAREVARRLGVPLDLACVDAARHAHAAVAEGRADLCFLADEPARAEAVAFTRPYVLIEGVHAVDDASPIASARDVDADGVRIGVREGSAYDLFLTRTLEHAVVVRADEAAEVFEADGLEVAAGVRQPMTAWAAATGRRVLEPAFMEIRQAVGVPRPADPGALAWLDALVGELIGSGFVADALVRSGVEATVAPAG